MVTKGIPIVTKPPVKIVSATTVKGAVIQVKEGSKLATTKDLESLGQSLWMEMIAKAEEKLAEGG